MKHLACILVLASGSLVAQCGGNGGNGRLSSDPQAIGTTVRLIIEGGPGATSHVYISPGLAPLTIPAFGTVCLDLAALGFDLLLSASLPGNGRLEIPFFVPNDPALLAVLAFLQGLVSDPAAPAGQALTNTLRVEFGTPDGFETAPPLLQPRALATATLGSDGRLLIAGGGSGTALAPSGTATTEIYDPVTRTILPGPTMGSSRAFHTATALLDGRILLCGGVSGGSGAVTASCEIYDANTGLFTPAASMSSPRAVHTATLLADGRVLVAGGAPSFAGTTIGTVLNGSLTTGEVYHPVANTWTPVSNAMASRRFGAAAARVANGTVMVISGLNGATNLFGTELPTFTTTVSIYNPATNSFSAGTAINTGRAFHGAVILPGGSLWVTGGLLSGLIPAVTNTTRIWNGSAWSAGPSLPQAIALPSHLALRSGGVHTYGGLNGDLVAQTFGAVAECTRHNGATLATTNPLPAAQGAALVAQMADGSVFVGGGSDGSGAATAAASLHVPAP